MEYQVGQIAKLLSKRPQEALPSNVEMNPRENVQASTTRSGLQLLEIIVTCSRAQFGKAPMDEDRLVQEPNISEKQSKKVNQNHRHQRLQHRLRHTCLIFPSRKDYKSIIWMLNLVNFGRVQEAKHQHPICQCLSSNAKFIKDILSNKRKIEDYETVMLMEECSTILQNKLPQEK